jgi:hypothetical protein
MSLCRIEIPVLENIFRGYVYEPKTGIIYDSLCSMNPIGKSINGKIKWFKK